MIDNPGYNYRRVGSDDLSKFFGSENGGTFWKESKIIIRHIIMKLLVGTCELFVLCIYV